MKAGLLKTKITIQQQTATQDAAGQITGGWSTLASVWADVRQQRGLEAIRADAMSSATKASIRIRRRTDVNAGMRVLQGTTLYNILAVSQDVNSKDYTDLICELYV
jgi:SPP1 family predicted phage head-tail adaptor